VSEDIGGAGHGQAPIIIKKKRGGEHAHHGGAWKVAYADMVTTLMALFIVLWILAQSDEFKANIAHYFQDPVGFQDGGAATPFEGGTRSGEPSVLDNPQPPPPENQTASEQIWRARAAEIRQAIEKVPSISKYREQIQLSLTPEGLRINLLESKETPLFKLGGTDLNSEAVAVLRTIAQEVNGFPNPIVIEGHTDSRPFGAGSKKTNWELSTGRAHTARRVFEQTGVDTKRMLEVRGFSDRQLYNPLDPEDSRNRRISITLLSQEALDRRKQIPEETIIPWLTENEAGSVPRSAPQLPREGGLRPP
jgi:chemotaxis protein MotB